MKIQKDLLATFREPQALHGAPAPGKRTMTSGLIGAPGRDEAAMQRKAAGDARGDQARREAAEGRADLDGALAGGGQALPSEVRAKMEQAFGADFSSVRVHEGAAAEDVGALAFTRGKDVSFAPGRYDPHSQRGQELLGHELAHVVQQAQGRVAATAQAKGVALNDDVSLEREADEQGARAARGEPVGGGPVALAAPSLASGAPIQRAESVADVASANQNALIGGVGELHDFQQSLAGDAGADVLLGHLRRMGPGQRALVRADANLVAPLLAGRTQEQLVALVGMLGYPTVHEEINVLRQHVLPETLYGLASKLREGAITAAIEASFTHAWSSWHELLPKGDAMTPRTRAELLAWSYECADARRVRQVMERRFDLTITNDWGVDAWPVDALRVVWKQLEALPAAHVTQNEMFSTLKRTAARLRQGGGVAVHGNTPTIANVASTVEVGFRDEDITASDDGRYTTEDQLLHNTSILPATVAHEIGHTIDLQGNYTDAGGPFRTQQALGAWTIHSDANQLLETLIARFGDPGEESHPALVRCLEVGCRAEGDHALVDFINAGRRSAQPAYKQDQSRVIAGRYYYQSSNTSYWLSYDAGIRQGHGPSNYAYEDVKEFFAELYALYYSTPNPGQVVRAWNQAIYDWFTTNVDKGYSTRKS